MSKPNVVVATPLPTLLAVAFVVLKLTGYIDWSWWWVLSPLWIPLVIVLVIVFVFVAISAVVEIRGRS
jgi:hypothetical protein